jgi:hypothetical protein
LAENWNRQVKKDVSRTFGAQNRPSRKLHAARTIGTPLAAPVGARDRRQSRRVGSDTKRGVMPACRPGSATLALRACAMTHSPQATIDAGKSTVLPPESVGSMLVILSRYKWPLLFSAIAIVYPAFCLSVGDIIPVKDGLGYDGDRWAQYAQRIRPWMLTRRIDAYSFQKSLSWFILGGSYWVIGKLSTAFAEATQTFNVTIALVSYWIANSICLAATAFLWKGILDEVKVREPVALLSYFLLFVNVGNLRMPAFYVTISDVQMTLVGTLVLYLFIESRQWSLVPVGFLSGFVRAGLPEAVALLVLFPRRDVARAAPSQDGGRFGAAMAAFAALALAAACIWHSDRLRQFTPAVDLIWVSALILCAYAGTALYFLLRELTVADLRPHLADVGKALLVVLPVLVVLKLVAGPSILPFPNFVREVVGTGTYLPGVSLVALVVYYGPGFLLVLLLFPRLAKAAATFGPGLIVFLSLGVGMSMFSESRIAAVYVPAFLFVVTLVLSEMRGLARWGYYATAALCVLFSKIWLPMRWSDAYSETFSRFPEQLYFMNFGPYMSVQTFALQAAACVVAMLILAHWLYDLRIVGRAMRVVLPPYKWPCCFLRLSSSTRPFALHMATSFRLEPGSATMAPLGPKLPRRLGCGCWKEVSTPTRSRNR